MMTNMLAKVFLLLVAAVALADKILHPLSFYQPQPCPFYCIIIIVIFYTAGSVPFIIGNLLVAVVFGRRYVVLCHRRSTVILVVYAA